MDVSTIFLVLWFVPYLSVWSLIKLSFKMDGMGPLSFTFYPNGFDLGLNSDDGLRSGLPVPHFLLMGPKKEEGGRKVVSESNRYGRP